MTKKLKPHFGIVGFIPAIFSFLLLGVVSALFGLRTGLTALGVLLLLGVKFYHPDTTPTPPRPAATPPARRGVVCSTWFVFYTAA